MNRIRTLSAFVCALVFSPLVGVPQEMIRQTPAVVTAPVDVSQRVDLAHTVRLELRNAADQGRTDGSKVLKSIMLSFAKTQAQEAALQQLLTDQQNPASPQYHQWLTPEQYGERFGVNSDDINAVVEWLEGAGFANIQVANGKDFVTFDGNVTTTETSLGTEIHNFTLDGETHFANATNVMIPAAFKTLIKGISGLHDFHPKSMHIRTQTGPSPQYNGGPSSHFLAAEDIQTIYDVTPLYGAGYTGSGVNLVIAGEYALPKNDSNVSTYRTLNGLPTINLQVIPVNGTSTSAEADEAYLDVEVAGAVAKNANLIYVYQADAFQAATYAIDKNLGEILSTSYGGCEADFASVTYEDLFARANTQGMTVIAASGDTGAAGCDQGTDTTSTHGLAVEYPASSTYITGVGGTTLQDGSGSYWGSMDGNGGSALKYIPEVAWNDTVEGSGQGCHFNLFLVSGIGCASGGGSSIYFAKPVWQVGNGVPNGNQSVTNRFVPDLAFAASADHDGYLICIPSYCAGGTLYSSKSPNNVFGGTSAAAPLFAGIVALIDQKLGPLDPRQGNINSRIYSLAASSPSVFHDITLGTNRVPAKSTGYVGYGAGPGYDLITGWGSVDAKLFVNAFTSVPVITSWSVSPTSFTLGGEVTVSYNAYDPSGTNLSRAELWKAPDSNGQPGTWAEIGTAQSLSGSGPTVVKLTDSPLAAGKYWYGTHLFNSAGDQSNEPSPVQVTVNATLAPVISVTPATAVGFPNTSDGSTSSRNFTVKNTGGGTLTGTASVAAPFSIVAPANYSLAAGVSKTVTVNFTPTAAQTYSQSLSFTGGGGATRTVAGIGVSAAAPTISFVTPNPVIGSNSPQQFAITGTGFTAQSTVTLWDLTANQVFTNRAISSQSPTQIVINPTFTTAAHSWAVEVINGTLNSGQYDFAVQAPAAAPTISFVTPNPVIGSNSPQQFAITGTGFTAQSTVTLWDLTANQVFTNRAISSQSPTQIVINPTFTTAAHSWAVEVINGTLNSGQYDFAVQAPAAAPTISFVTPNPVIGSNSPQQFAITGTGFTAQSTVTLWDLTANQVFTNRAISSQSPTQIVINPTFTTAAHSWAVEVINGTLNSGQYDFAVQAPAAAPTISFVTPNPVIGSNSPQQFAITGTGFTAQSTVTLWDLTANQVFTNRAISSQSPTQIVINPTFTTAAHSWAVEVINGTLNSGQYDFAVQAPAAAPTISFVTPNPVIGSNSPQQFAITGTGFTAQSTVTLWDLTANQVFTNRAISSQSPTQIVINPTFTTAAHSWAVEVINGTLNSGQYDFAVQAPAAAPTISFVTPNPVIGSNSPQQFAITGTGFTAQSTVTLWDLTANQVFTNRAISSQSPTQIVINPTFTTAAHSWAVEVINGTLNSGQYDFAVQAPAAAPTISFVTPNPVIGSNSPQQFAITGTGFTAQSTVTLWDLTANQVFTNRAISSQSPTQIVINPTFTTAAHSWAVEVINGTLNSGQYDFAVH